MERAYVALGSNLGDREQRLRAAVRGLAQTPGLTVVSASSIHETAPVGPTPQGAYLNAAVAIDTRLGARALLERLQEIEYEQERVREPGVRWSARTLDLDLLLYADCEIAEPELEVPHPRMHTRSFVLEPLAEISPGHRHPRLGLTIRELADRCRNPNTGRVFAAAPLWPEPPGEDEEDTAHGDRRRQHRPGR